MDPARVDNGHKRSASLLCGSHSSDKLADFGGEFIGVPREHNGGFEHLACDIPAPIRSFLDGCDCLRYLSCAGCHQLRAARYLVRGRGLPLHRLTDIARNGLHLYDRVGDAPNFTHRIPNGRLYL